MFPCCRPQSCPAAQTQRTCPARVRSSRISAGLAERLVARAVTLVRGHPNAHERHYACATAAGMHAGRIQCSKVRVALRPGILVRVGHSDHAQHTCAHGMHGGKLARRKTSRRHRSTHATWLHADTNKHAGAHQRRGCSLAAVCMGTVHAHCTGPRPKTEYQRPGRDHVFADWFGCVCACFYSTTTCPVSLSQLLTSLLAVLGSSGPEAGDISWASLLNVSTSVGPEILLDLALPTEAYQSVPRPQDASPRGLVAA